MVPIIAKLAIYRQAGLCVEVIPPLEPGVRNLLQYSNWLHHLSPVQ